MSNAQMHLVAGTLCCLALAFVLYRFVHIGFSTILAGVVIGIIASEFPDVDHPKALPRKIMRGVMPALILFVFVYLFFAWAMFSKNILSILLFCAAPVLIIMSYEFFIPRHRGATHHWPGLVAVVAATIPISLAIGGVVNSLVLVIFAVLGFSTHILLDHL